MVTTYIIIFLSVVVFLAGIILVIFWGSTYETPKVRAGKQGERRAEEIIKQVLDEEDVLLTNICVEYEEKETELDIVIINKKGVYIIEVKNYSGKLVGKEDDYEWTKYKISRGGNVHEKRVRNPIKQVKRQVYILARFLKYYGINVWVDGYVLLLNKNSPVHGDMILESCAEIERAVHGRIHNSLDRETVLKIKELLYRQIEE